MSEISKVFVIHWVGPFSSIPEAKGEKKSEKGSIYIVTGKKAPNSKYEGIQYIGITGGSPLKRMKQSDDAAKIDGLYKKEYWIGRFSVKRYNSFGGQEDPKRRKVELVENLLIRYVVSIVGRDNLINTQKVDQNPKQSVAIISMSDNDSEGYFYQKSEALSVLPDVLLYDDGDFYSSLKLVHRFSVE